MDANWLKYGEQKKDNDMLIYRVIIPVEWELILGSLHINKEDFPLNAQTDDIVGIYKNNERILLKTKNKIFFKRNDEEMFIDMKSLEWTYRDGDLTITNYDSTEAKKGLSRKVLDLLQAFRCFNKYLPYKMRMGVLYEDIGFIDMHNYNSVIQGDDIWLVLREFRSITPEWMPLSIVNAETLEYLGSLEFYLKAKGDTNFSYNGNVSYEIKEQERRKGYATKALRLLRDYLRFVGDEYNKELYVSTEVDNVFSQKVALNNDGKLIYEGDVPGVDIVNILGKVKRVRIYRIDN